MNIFSENLFLKAIIANVSFILELLAVAIISFSIIFAVVKFLFTFFKSKETENSLTTFKQIVGRSVQIALELLIAADIINTVVLDATIQNVLVLGILVLIRTFLSWTLVLETEGQWPWKKGLPKEQKKY
jgi:uncharacterized membrane protein